MLDEKLITAFKNEDIHYIKSIISNIVNVNDVDPLNQTILMYAAYTGNTEIANLLLAHGANIDKNNCYYTALMIAAENGHAKMIKLLLMYGANANIENINGDSALIFAAGNGHVKIVKLLLKYEANVNIENKNGDSPLILAAEKGHVKVVEILLEHKANVNIENKNGDSPLSFAASNGHVKVVELLLKHKANANIENNNGDKPLNFAVYKGHVKVVALLLEHVSNVNIENNNGESPLSFAAYNGHVKIVNLLLAYGANIKDLIIEKINHEEIKMLFALHKAKYEEDTNLVEKFIMDEKGNFDLKKVELAKKICMKNLWYNVAENLISMLDKNAIIEKKKSMGLFKRFIIAIARLFNYFPYEQEIINDCMRKIRFNLKDNKNILNHEEIQSFPDSPISREQTFRSLLSTPLPTITNNQPTNISMEQQH